MAEVMTIDEVMENAEIKAGMNDLTSAMEQNPVMMKLVEAAETVEDLYQITKKFVKIAFDDFKKVFSQVANYFSEDKMVLSDEMLDDVVGGWSLSGWFKKTANKIACVAGCVAGIGAVVGGILLGGILIGTSNPIGLAAGVAVAGAGLVGGTALLLDCVHMLKNMD